MILYFISETGIAKVDGENPKTVIRTLKSYGFKRVTKAEYQRKQREIGQADAKAVRAQTENSGDEDLW